MQKHPMPLNKEVQRDGIQIQALSPPPESGQDRAMGARERYTSAVGWIADHIAILLFAVAFVGGAVAAMTASMSALRAYAPFSYVVAALVGALLTTLVIWALWAFARWVKHGTFGHVPRDNYHSQSVGAGAKGHDAAITASFPTQVNYEAPDIVEAKSRLCSFVVNYLSPAIHELGILLVYGAHCIRYADIKNLIAEFAYTGIQESITAAPSREVFVDVQSVRARSLVELEEAAVVHITGYVNNYSMLLKVVRAKGTLPGGSFANLFNREMPKWLEAHKRLLLETPKISSDIHFPRISMKIDSNTFNLPDYPAEELDAYVAGIGKPKS